ncbi:HlyD family efflux transporter periplasmic adaptor subunit [bacterium]|nr:HlyD family efflux transporter periplasmic adaptor subunit [bacterium]
MRRRVMKYIPKELIDKVLEGYIGKVTTRSRLIYWVVIIILVTAIIAMPLVYVDVAVPARGIFQSEIERQPIYAPNNGQVVQTAIKKGKLVNKGDTLLTIGSDAIQAELLAVNQRIDENNLAIQDLNCLLTVKLLKDKISLSHIVTKRYYAEYINLSRLLALQAQTYHQIKSDYERKKTLHEQKIIADADYEVSYFNFRAEEEKLNQSVAQALAKWELDLAQRKNDSIILHAELQRCNEEIKNRFVLAPLSGTIIQSADIQRGTFVYNNQQIAEITPVGDIQALCYVSPGDIGLVRPGLPVLLQVDALKYTEWGSLKANIIDVSNDLIIDNNQSAYFRIICKPEQDYLSLKNGVRADIIKGMSFNARIVVTQRSLFNLMFDKVDDWLNPYTN